VHKLLHRETRYVLFLTENYSALRILQQTNLLDHDPLILFGSSFPEDVNYTQVIQKRRAVFKPAKLPNHFEFIFYIPD